MFIIRDIFHLKFGHYKDAKSLLDLAMKSGMMPADAKNARVLSDFTGDSYRLVFEESYETLADYEKSLSGSMGAEEWQQWYEKFKPHVERSHREILKQVM